VKSTEISADIVVDTPRDEEQAAAQAAKERRAKVRIADQIGREHPHPLDDVMPRIAGAVIARNPQARADMDDLLDMVFGNNPPRRNP
jgi:hypothetical protein